MQRRRPFPPTTRRLALDDAIRLYCRDRNVVVGSVRYPFKHRVTVVIGRGRNFWLVKAWVRKPAKEQEEAEDQLYDRITRGIDRKMRELGWD